MGAHMVIMLFVDNKPIEMADTLEQAKQLAEQYIARELAVRIERTAAPAPVHAWNYDYEDQDWVERVG